MLIFYLNNWNEGFFFFFSTIEHNNKEIEYEEKSQKKR